MPGARPRSSLVVAALLVGAVATAWQSPGVAIAQSGTPTAQVQLPSPGVGDGATAEPPVPFRGPRLEWNPDWKKVDTEHYLLFGAGVSLSLGKFLIGPRQDKQRGGVLIDEDVRSTLRLENLAGERFARDTSDVLLASLLSYPFFDALVIAGWYRQSPGVAEQVALISAEALGITAGLQAIANIAVSRERPYGRRCGSGKPADGRDCDSRTRYFSFFSGHSSLAFTAAGVMCMHHSYLPLYGGGSADALTCAAGFAAASVTAALRVVGDQHYFSDIAVGALIGTLSGLGVPWLFHYRHGTPTQATREQDGLRVRLLPTPTGATLLGSFQ